jgi:hypothetical protein
LSQSSVLVGALLAGFIVWLILNGKLGTYWSLLLGGAAATATSSPATPPAKG